MPRIAWEEIYCRECCGNAKRSWDEIRGLCCVFVKIPGSSTNITRYDKIIFPFAVNNRLVLIERYAFVFDIGFSNIFIYIPYIHIWFEKFVLSSIELILPQYKKHVFLGNKNNFFFLQHISLISHIYYYFIEYSRDKARIRNMKHFTFY